MTIESEKRRSVHVKNSTIREKHLITQKRSWIKVFSFWYIEKSMIQLVEMKLKSDF